MYRRLSALAAAMTLLAALPVHAAPRLEADPTTFDFGWVPDNAKVSAEFTIRNTGEEPVPLKEVLPTCGCTAADFTPSDIGSKEESHITLTFNTRGYRNMKFRKPTRVKTDVEENTLIVNLVGYVTNPEALIRPDGDGVADFPPTATSKKQKIAILNKTDHSVKLKMVQRPAGWVTAQVPSSEIKPGASADVEVEVDGSVKDTRNTSFTLAPEDSPSTNRVTIAVRTGTPPPPYRINPTALKPKPQPVPVTPKPSTQTKKK